MLWLRRLCIQQAVCPNPEVPNPVMWCISAARQPCRLMGWDGRGKQLEQGPCIYSWFNTEPVPVMGTVFVSFQTECLLSLPLKRGHLFVSGRKSRFHRKGKKKESIGNYYDQIDSESCQTARRLVFVRSAFLSGTWGFTRNSSARSASTWRNLSHPRRRKKSFCGVFCKRAVVTVSRTMHNLAEL